MAPRPCRPNRQIVIAVSEDIDPENTDAVFWSLAYRANPVEDVQIVPYRAAGHGPKSGPRGEELTMLIDATLKDIAPPLALPKREYMEGARKIWDELGLPPLTPQPPGTAIRSATGMRRGMFTPAAQFRANGKKPARKRLRSGAAVSRRRRR